MPSVSRHQHAFMALSRTQFGRAALERHGHDPAPIDVANDFMHADKGHTFSAKGEHDKYGSSPDDYKPAAKKGRHAPKAEEEE